MKKCIIFTLAFLLTGTILSAQHFKGGYFLDG